MLKKLAMNSNFGEVLVNVTSEEFGLDEKKFLFVWMQIL